MRTPLTFKPHRRGAHRFVPWVCGSLGELQCVEPTCVLSMILHRYSYRGRYFRVVVYQMYWCFVCEWVIGKCVDQRRGWMFMYINIEYCFKAVKMWRNIWIIRYKNWRKFTIIRNGCKSKLLYAKWLRDSLKLRLYHFSDKSDKRFYQTIFIIRNVVLKTT